VGGGGGAEEESGVVLPRMEETGREVAAEAAPSSEARDDRDANGSLATDLKVVFESRG
jgi:hypothetical protein